MDKVDLIRIAIDKALKRQSKLTPLALSIPMLGSLNIRHLLNNLGAISTVYIECGSHIGGTFTSTVLGNSNLTDATAIDSWESDQTEGKTYEKDFMDNIALINLNGTTPHIFKADAFDVDLSGLPKADLFLYDAGHSYEQQRKAISYYLPYMADEFILCVDDYDWKDVHMGTGDGIRRDCNLDILFWQEFVGNDHDNDGWWNGFYIALLKKKQ